MTNQDVINFLNQVRKILLDDKSWLESTIQPINEAFDKAISALQAQDSETRKICKTCKHDPPSKKWPCVDCDMREPADRWELQDVPDTNDGDMISKRAVLDILYLDPGIDDIREKMIKELPSAEPEIVRCKDCEHWKNEHLCESLSRFGSFETKADFYCGYKERRTDD